MKKSALIFGYNEYASEIAKNVSYKYKDITIFRLKSELKRDDLDEYNIEKFDLSDEWLDLREQYDLKESVAFCVLEDIAENIFLTISLRAEFKELTIIALAHSKENANKLTMAGANKVIPLVEATSSIISDMLNKPVVTEVLHNILYEKSNLKVAQIKVQGNDYFDGKYPADIEWSREHGVIVLSINHADGNSEFIYSSQAKHHIIEEGDVFVVVGFQYEIDEFEKLMGGKACQ